MMITERFDLGVLSAPLAALDRRALSQAWYSALHLQREKPAEPKSTRSRPQAGSATSNPTPRSAQAQRGMPKIEMARRAPVRATTVAVSVPRDRRALRCALAQKIERKFSARETPRPATFTLDGAQGRVQIILRSQGKRLELVAICAPRARSIVAQALAQARYALASRGIALAAALYGETVC